MSVLTFFTAFAFVLHGTAANVILKLVITAPAVLTGTGVTLVGVCKNIQCQSKSGSSGSIFVAVGKHGVLLPE